MKYETRLQRLESKVPSDAPLNLVVALVDPRRGVVSAYVLATGARCTREDGESAEQLMARVPAG